MVVVFLLTVFVDLIKAVAVGMAIAGLIFMKRMSDLQLRSINMYRDADESTPLQGEERRILRESAGQILLIHFGSPMSFGAAKGMARQLSLLGDYRALILDLPTCRDRLHSNALAVRCHPQRGACRAQRGPVRREAFGARAMIARAFVNRCCQARWQYRGQSHPCASTSKSNCLKAD